MTNDGNELEEHREAEQFTGSDMFVCLLVALSVFAFVAYFAGLGRGRVAGLCAGVDFAVVRLRWHLNQNLRFWIAITLILFVQAAIVVAFPFGPESMPVYGLLPAGLVIYLFDEGVILLLRK